MIYKIKYGVEGNFIDVTDICLKHCLQENFIFIPCIDLCRAKLFTDPIVNVLKYIFIYQEAKLLRKCDPETFIYIDTKTDRIYLNEMPPNKTCQNLFEIQNKLKIDHGTFMEEYPEQLMAFKYIKGDEKVLEIGGNIGRNSVIIAYILNQKGNNNLVTLESDEEIAKMLIHNKDKNNLDFSVEPSALSKRNLIQQGWVTKESDVVLPGFKKVNTIDLEQLNKKYNIKFDTLVLDCEGAFYYILMDMPEILTDVKTIIMENDYWDIKQKQYVEKVLTENNFKLDYSEAGGWGPCADSFYEVWVNKNL